MQWLAILPSGLYFLYLILILWKSVPTSSSINEEPVMSDLGWHLMRHRVTLESISKNVCEGLTGFDNWSCRLNIFMTI